MSEDTSQQSLRNRLAIAILGGAHILMTAGTALMGLTLILATIDGVGSGWLIQAAIDGVGVLFVGSPLYINWKSSPHIFDPRRPETEIRAKLAEMRDLYGTLPGVGPNLRVAESIAALEWVLREEPIDPTDKLDDFNAEDNPDPEDTDETNPEDKDETTDTPSPPTETKRDDDDGDDDGPTPKNLKK